ncbi:ubiquinone/menaquinone biosynthesis C-methylase UbiE [Aequitasia blattaphilus]|uniref:Class I SAM-dependent methyltransferase n=1 Tax=Aequitasia blattaphilus TaxID=2949332 RepID=A0ABT1E5F7_9FIRM|nr:class I SAM-dependent methyltransferase [Aequitasia blattaphilus]MCP1100983.1 class I SAM-dependent methyltransferase [Aequitasia blattaphilus]MCR8613623.1 class I SAM-dependent methyltransferase [Aequitasia blattaphilus]
MAETFVCPWWAGHSLNWRARKILHSPKAILGPYLKAGMTALDIGCGMGYFTIPMAKMVGDNGKVIAVDLQQKMLAGIQQNAQKSGVDQLIIPHQCEQSALSLEDYTGCIDFALAFMMAHEVPDQDRLAREVYAALRDGGLLLFAEPIGHVGKSAYRKSLRIFEQHGFRVREMPRIAICRAVLLEK